MVLVSSEGSEQRTEMEAPENPILLPKQTTWTKGDMIFLDNTRLKCEIDLFRKEGRLYCCGSCSYSTTTEEGIYSHQSMHAENPFVCGVCQKAFSRKYRLTAHIRTHTGEKPFSCDVCNRKFALIGSLYNHRLLHIRQKVKAEH